MRTLQLLTLVLLATAACADPLYNVYDCGLPGSDLYAACLALFPPNTQLRPTVTSLGIDPAHPLSNGVVPAWEYPTGLVDAVSPDGSYAAIVILNQGADEFFVDIWHNGWSDGGLLSLVSSGFTNLHVTAINDSGEAIGVGCFEDGDGYFVSSLNMCYALDDNTNDIVSGGLGIPLELNDAGQIFMQGRKYSFELLNPPGAPIPLGIPEPATLLLLATAAGITLFVFWQRRMGLRSRYFLWAHTQARPTAKYNRTP